MKVDGQCLCGFLMYEAYVDPSGVTICNCTDCQIHSGSAFRVSVSIEANTFKLLSGRPKTYVKTAASGNRRELAFCPQCGTPVYSRSADNKQGPFGLRVGTLRQRELLVPAVQIWCRSALGWVDKINEIPKIQTE